MVQKLTSNILQVLNGNTLVTPPIWMMRQAGRHLPEYLATRKTTKNFIEFCLTPTKAAEVTLQPVDRYDMDAAILFADILLIPIILGTDVSFQKGVGPILSPISTKQISKFTKDFNLDKISSVFETVSLVRKSLDKNKALIGFCGGPWTVATYMIEGQGSPKKEIAKRFAYENPQAMDDLLEALVITSADYLIGQAKAGADVLKIFESWAEGLAPELFEKLVIRPTKKIISLVRQSGVQKPIIGFPRGAGLNTFDYAKQTGVTALALGTDIHMAKIRSQIPKDMPYQGNLDPLALRIGGNVLKQAVQNVLDTATGPHIFNLGHGVMPDVKIENVHAVIDHIRTGEGAYV